jgi:hypothetical protein
MQVAFFRAVEDRRGRIFIEALGGNGRKAHGGGILSALSTHFRKKWKLGIPSQI